MECNCSHEGHEHHGRAAEQDCHDCRGSQEGCCGHKTVTITRREYELLAALAQVPYLPLARFLLKSSKSEQLEAVAMAPVYLEDEDEPRADVRKTSEALTALEEKGLITLDYGEGLIGCDYEDYLNSSVFLAFEDTVRDGGSREGFLFDRAVLERGSMALTPMGLNAAEQLEAARRSGEV